MAETDLAPPLLDAVAAGERLPSPHGTLWAAPLLASVGVCLAALTLRTPILYVGFLARSRVAADWGVLWRPDALAYERALLILPWLASGLLIAAGYAWWIAAWRRDPKASHVPRSLLALTTSGFVLCAVYGARWLGFVIARSWESGPTPVALGPQVWCFLAVGNAGLAAVCGALVVKRDRFGPSLDAGLSLLAAAGLVLSPLLPLARVGLWGGSQAWVDELTLEVLGARPGGGWLDAPDSLALARGLAWSLFVMHVALWMLPARVQGLPTRLGLQVASVAAWGLLGVAVVRGFVQVPELGTGATAFPNPFLILASLLGVGLGCWRLVVASRTRAISGAKTLEETQ